MNYVQKITLGNIYLLHIEIDRIIDSSNDCRQEVENNELIIWPLMILLLTWK